MSRISLCFPAIFLFLAPTLSADDLPRAGFTIKDVAWFAGQWRSPADDKRLHEEHWTEPAGGAMAGMFRMVIMGKPALYELILIEETADGVFMRLRHFKAGMTEVEKEPIRLKLVKASPMEAVFENPDNDKPKRLTYSRPTGEQLTVTVELTRDGKPATFALKFERAKK